MRIPEISYQQPSMTSGLYFVKNSNVLFSTGKKFNYVTGEVIKTSKDGYRYIEDSTIPPDIVKKFSQSPFIKYLAKKFDTFIFFREIPKNFKTKEGRNNFSYVKISWADKKSKIVQIKEAYGKNPISQKLATENLFENLRQNKFRSVS